MLNTEEFKEALRLYLNGESMKHIADTLHVNQFTLRRLFVREGLAIKVRDRAVSYEAYQKRELNVSNIEDMDEDIGIISHKLDIAERALIRTRAELNYRRRTIRNEEYASTLRTKVLQEVQDALIGTPVYTISDVPKVSSESNGVKMLLLSDVHAEEIVSKDNVGRLNEYNWEEMERRVTYLFDECLADYSGERKFILFIMGDIISGIIHNTLEHTSKPTALAIVEIADILAKQTARLATRYPKVHVGVVSGNHSRLSEKPATANKAYDLEFLLGELFRAKVSHIPTVTVDVSTTGFTTATIGEHSCLAHHGDIFKGSYSTNRTSTIKESCLAVTGIRPDHIFEGHSHQFSYHNNDTGVSIVNGCVIGSNEYGVVSGFRPIRPSQTIISFLDNGLVTNVRQVFLDT